MKSVLAATALSLAAAAPAAAAPTQWAKASGGNGHLYEAVRVTPGIGWVEARLAAANRGCGWYLATLTSPAENTFVYNLIKGRPGLFVSGRYGPWLGGYQKDSRIEPGGDWRWVTGETFTAPPWAAGQPTNTTTADPAFEPGIAAGQSREVLAYLLGGRWGDAIVNAQAQGYVVEFDTARQTACRNLG